MLTLKLEGTPGDTVHETCAELCRIAMTLNCWTELSFNGRMLVAGPRSRPELMVQDYYKMVQEEIQEELDR